MNKIKSDNFIFNLWLILTVLDDCQRILCQICILSESGLYTVKLGE